MKRSLNEIGGMIHKAARGAGLPLGHADDLASAAVVMLAAGGAASGVTQALNDKTGVAFAGPIAIDAVLCGDGEQRFRNVAALTLVQAMIAVRQVEVTAQIDGTDVVLRTGPPLSITKADGPVAIPDADWQIWSDLAARTYVPATEASRIAGAGAGLNDND